MKKTKDIKIYLLFLIFAIFSILLQIKYPQLTLRSDGSFQLSRVQEIFENLKDGSFFTFIATHTFNHSGVANFIFYPSVFLYPMAFLRFIFKPLQSFYIWYGIFVFLTLSISFFSMKEFSKDRKKALVFSLLYTFAGYHIYLGIGNYVLGEFIAYTFIPLAFLGFYEVFLGDNSKYLTLSIGMSLILYSHFLSVILVSSIMGVLGLLLLCLKKVNKLKVRIISLIKSIGLFIALSLWILVPFIKAFFTNNVLTPYKTFTFISTPTQMLSNSINNVITKPSTIGPLLLLILLIGILTVKHLGKVSVFYFLGLIIFICATTLVPWIILRNISIFVKVFGIIQFPFRLLSYAILFLSIYGSYMIIDCLKNNIHKFMLISLSLFTMMFYLSAIGYQVHENNINVSKNYLEKKDGKKLVEEKGIDNNNYNYIFNYSPETGSTDYFPKNSLSYTKQIERKYIIINGKKTKANVQYYPNKFTFKIKTTNAKNVIKLPVLKYKDTMIKLNGKLIKDNNNNGIVDIISNKKGVNTITVYYQQGRIFYIAFIFSIFIWLVILIRFIKMRFK